MPIHIVTDVVIYMDNLRVCITKLSTVYVFKHLRIITVIQEVLLLLFIMYKLEPALIPSIDVRVISWLRHGIHIRWKRVMVTKCWVNSDIFKLSGYHLCHIFHDLNI